MTEIKFIAEVFLSIVAVCGIFVGWYKFMVNSVIKKVRSMCQCDLLLLRKSALAEKADSLERKCEYYIERNYATSDNRKTVQLMYDVYAELGGNGYIKDLKDKVMNLPFEPKMKGND